MYRYFFTEYQGSYGSILMLKNKFLAVGAESTKRNNLSYTFFPSLSIRIAAHSQYPGSISIPIHFRLHCEAATSVEPLPMKGSSTVSPVNEKSFMQRSGSSTGNGAGCPVLFLLSPLNAHNPFVQSMNSFRVISDIFDPLVFFHVFL